MLATAYVEVYALTANYGHVFGAEVTITCLGGGGLINHEDLPNGRKKNSLAWAGLGNCYFWVDPTAGKLGYVVSAILPFFDKDVLHLADALERAVYDRPAAKEIGEKGSNFSGGIAETDSGYDSGSSS